MKAKFYLISQGTFFFAVIVFFSSCTHEPQLIEELDPVCYATDIEPLLQASCGTTGCHATAGHETNFSTGSYSSIMNIVEPGDAKGSKLYKVITDIYSDEMMPPDRPLTKSQRNMIQVWIEQGALNNNCSADTSDNNGQPKSDSICFTQKIQPLLVSSCATTGCHDATTAKEGIVLTDYNSIMNSKGIVVPFQPSKSEIYKVLFESGDDRMPPSPMAPLTAEEKEYIRKWIAEGALNSDCPDQSCDTANEVSFANSVYPIIDYSCVGCHNGSPSGAGIDLRSYNNIVDIASTIVNNQSRLVGVIKKEPGFKPMPPSGALSDCDIRKIELWIEQGLQNN